MKRYFYHCKTLAAVKAEYKRLAKENHPDVGGDEQTMKTINAQYEEAIKWIATHGEGADRAAAAAEVPQEYVAAVAAVINLVGLEIDLVGSWIWVTGATYSHRDALKAAGYMWASRKHAWYWRPADAASKGSRKSLDEIKAKYGCTRLNGSDVERVAIPA